MFLRMACQSRQLAVQSLRAWPTPGSRPTLILQRLVEVRPQTNITQSPGHSILCLLICSGGCNRKNPVPPDQIGHNGRADGTGELRKTRTQSTTCFQKQNGSSWNVQSNGTDRSQSKIQGNCVLNSNPWSWLINMKGHCFCISHRCSHCHSDHSKSHVLSVYLLPLTVFMIKRKSSEHGCIRESGSGHKVCGMPRQRS